MAAATQELTLEALDNLQDEGKHTEIIAACKAYLGDNPDDKDWLWRKARAHFDLQDNMPASDSALRAAELRAGLEDAKHCLELDESFFLAHKWFAILKSALGEHLPTKEKIAGAFEIREHADKAVELQPNDATSLHLLGRWCFGVASIGWLERKAASVLFATPPESSYEEALSFYKRADEINPTLRNTVCIGDTYAAMKRWSEAKEAFQKAIEWENVTSASDKAQVAEAHAKIKKC